MRWIAALLVLIVLLVVMYATRGLEGVLITLMAYFVLFGLLAWGKFIF